MSEKSKEQVLTNGLRETLKSIMQNEIEKIPKQLEGLEPKERLNFIVKLMPYVFPKLQGINIGEGEPFNPSW